MQTIKILMKHSPDVIKKTRFQSKIELFDQGIT